MLKIENPSVEGWIPALRGMRNPMNSWDKADTQHYEYKHFELGSNDRSLMERLVKAGCGSTSRVGRMGRGVL